jgi:seryl-tRNA synthetase
MNAAPALALQHGASAEDLRAAQEDLRDRLVAAGLLVPMGAAGLMGRADAFEQVVLAIGHAVNRVSAVYGETVWHFPPVIPRALVHRVGYLGSFPDMLGSLHAFTGTEADQKVILDAVEAGSDYGAQFAMSDATLLPASCYPIYLALEGTSVPVSGRAFHTVGQCYRHEPSPDPARLRCFRQHEHVMVAAPPVVDQYVDAWHVRAVDLLRSLGLDAELVVANDPFFGRAGRLMKAQQNAQALKHEVVVPITSLEKRTAVASINKHHDHFGTPFSIGLSDGDGPANTACVGFGLERITLALFALHGFNTAAWPAAVRAVLWPSGETPDR